MGFASKGVWVMGYHGCMGYEALFPANQLGGLKKVWNLREYGVCEPWVTRESTVCEAVPLITIYEVCCLPRPPNRVRKCLCKVRTLKPRRVNIVSLPFCPRHDISYTSTNRHSIWYYALPLPRHPLSVGTFLSLSPSTKPLATKFKTGPPGSNSTYFRFSPSKKQELTKICFLRSHNLSHSSAKKCDILWLPTERGCRGSGRA